MIDEFRPFMTEEQVVLFRGYMAEVEAAEIESREVLAPALVDSGALDAAEYDAQFGLVATFNDQWPAIDADMTDLLDTMDRNLDNFAAVDALPSFDLFPWFFVIPGLLVIGLGVAALLVGRTRRPKGLLVAIGVLGVAIALAPVAFQMFGRAPEGGDMIDDFRPMMVRERVQNVQGYFITMGGAESQLRTSVIPLASEETDLDAASLAAISQFSDDWQSIVGDFAPMVAAMSDTVDNYEAVDSLPPFALFPWFFVIPGVLIAVLAFRALPPNSSTTSEPPGD
ncbi:MAG: hypothetical protein ACR2O6_00745 [Ilumatobacteraceae bacterium]